MFIPEINPNGKLFIEYVRGPRVRIKKRKEHDMSAGTWVCPNCGGRSDGIGHGSGCPTPGFPFDTRKLVVEHMNAGDDQPKPLWREGTSPDPTIKRSFAAAADAIRKSTESEAKDAEQVDRFRKFSDLIRSRQYAYKPNRYACYRVGANRLLDAIAILMGHIPQYAVKWAECPWPKGARCVGVREDLWSRSFILTMEHDSFPEVPEGAPFPVLNDMVTPEFVVVKLGQPEVE